MENENGGSGGLGTWMVRSPKEFPGLAVPSHSLPSVFLSLSHHLYLYVPQMWKPHTGAWSHGSSCSFGPARGEAGLGDMAMELGIWTPGSMESVCFLQLWHQSFCLNHIASWIDSCELIWKSFQLLGNCVCIGKCSTCYPAKYLASALGNVAIPNFVIIYISKNMIRRLFFPLLDNLFIDMKLLKCIEVQNKYFSAKIHYDIWVLLPS